MSSEETTDIQARKRTAFAQNTHLALPPSASVDIDEVIALVRNVIVDTPKRTAKIAHEQDFSASRTHTALVDAIIKGPPRKDRRGFVYLVKATNRDDLIEAGFRKDFGARKEKPVGSTLRKSRHLKSTQ